MPDPDPLGIDVYEGLLDWAARLGGVSTSAAFRPLFESLARIGDRPIDDYRDFVGDFIGRLDEALPGSSRGNRSSST